MVFVKFRTVIFFILSYTLIVASAASPNRLDDGDENKFSPLEHDSAHDKHFEGGVHNVQYDHEAFLGEDESKTFDQLPPDESKRRLGLIVDRIDEDKDGFVTLSELKNWIKYTQRRYIDEDVNRLWNQHNPNNNETISWITYRRAVYGFVDGMDEGELEHEENGVSYKKMIARDERRWKAADDDSDGSLTRQEFTNFLHPEDQPNMREVVLTETIEDIDKNKDGKISIEEYIGDMYRSGDEDDEEPAWVISERESFSKFRDTNGDGFLDREEVKAWVVPPDFDHAESEAKHLIFEADQDDDEKLTKDEILLKYDIFVGSQATDFGEALARHDEF